MDKINTSLESLFKGMDGLVNTKTVVGEAMKVDDAIIIPLIDVSCGMASGEFAEHTKNKTAGGMSAKMSPSAVLIIQNGITKVVNIKNQDSISKFLDFIPDVINKFLGDKEISEETVELAKDIHK